MNILKTVKSKYVKKIIYIIGGVLPVILIAGFVKFNILSNLAGYDVDGNKTENSGIKIDDKNKSTPSKKVAEKPIRKWVFDKDNEKPVVENNDTGRRWLVEDAREYQHGIDILQKVEGNFLAIWASSGKCLKPWGAREDGEWTHDVCWGEFSGENPELDPIKIIKAPLAQEPASSALNSEGHIMITMEDAWRARNELAQTYGVYNSDRSSINPYQKVIFDGGHSGHVASVGNKFVVFYSDEWVDGGGVNNLGSGDDVLMSVYDSEGKFLSKHKVAVGRKTRDWWPLVAGSEDKALLVWQRFVNYKKYVDLMISVYDGEEDKFIKQEIPIKSQVKYYTYDVQYLKDIDRFLIAGAKVDSGGFAILLDTRGEVVAKKDLPLAIAREAQSASKSLNPGEVKVVYPASPDKLLALAVDKNSITVEGEVTVDYHWEISGTDGVFLDNNEIYFLSLSPKGVKEMKVRLYNLENKK